MKTIKFYGFSDDLVEISGPLKGCDEYSAYKDLEFDIVSPRKDMMRVITHYGSNGCWSFAPSIAEEDLPFPNWKISFEEARHGYSTVMSVEVPDETVIKKVG